MNDLTFGSCRTCSRTQTGLAKGRCSYCWGDDAKRHSKNAVLWTKVSLSFATLSIGLLVIGLVFR